MTQPINSLRPYEIGKEIALTTLPFLTLYKPLSFPLSIGTGVLRTGISAFQLHEALQKEDQKKILSQFVHTTVAVISLAGTFFAHPVGILISTTYDLLLELGTLKTTLEAGKYKEAAISASKILGHCCYLAVFLHGGPEITLCFFALQVLCGLIETHSSFKQGHYITATGHLIMSILRGSQATKQVKIVQLKWALESLLKDPYYVGKLGDKWQFPSDHLPVGAKVGSAHVISWNILNDHFISWVTEKDSQGLNGSLISELDKIPSDKFEGLTKRDELIMTYLLNIMQNPAHSDHLILNLQECSPEFIKAFQTCLPANMGMILSDETLKKFDQEITIYNKDTFTYIQQESSITRAFPTSDPKRTLMDLVFLEKTTQEKFQIINAHLPGDPKNPGTYDFARYLSTHMRSDCISVALGDMNFTEYEVQKAFLDQGSSLELHNLVHYNTNIGANTFDAKSIDHIYVTSSTKAESFSPNEILPNLKATVDLLTPPEELNQLLQLEELQKEIKGKVIAQKEATTKITVIDN